MQTKPRTFERHKLLAERGELQSAILELDEQFGKADALGKSIMETMRLKERELEQVERELGLC